MSRIVPVSERPSRLFIEGFWFILEGIHSIFTGITLIMKGISTLFAGIILNAGIIFATVINALILPPAFIFVIGISEIYKLVLSLRRLYQFAHKIAWNRQPQPTTKTSKHELHEQTPKRADIKCLGDEQCYEVEDIGHF
ncbi:hypothetical protein IFR05_014255 [Cadophora sp. M221]|nr:hypothetical protein IFR05_014255 [Cadophora sp. M221]